MSNLQSSYNKILMSLHELSSEDNYLNQRRLPKLTDKELIALNLAAESLGIDSERYLFKRLPVEIAGKIERSVYNRRKRRLANKITDFQQAIASLLAPSESYYLIDSMPFEVCKLTRASRNNLEAHSPEVAPDYGYCASQKTHYFGYKLHAVCTTQGVIKLFDLSPASVHDIHYLNDVSQQLGACVLVGDKGYLSQSWQRDLFNEHRVRLETPKRKNQKGYKPYPAVFRKARKRIETLFSQLCDQFMIRRNYAKTLAGISARVIAKITALTMIQWLNVKNGKPMNHLKIVIS